MQKISICLISVLIAFVITAPALSYAMPLECYCVMWIRETYNVPIYGDAKLQVPNIAVNTVKEGDIALYRYPSGIYHAAVVTKIFPNGVYDDSYTVIQSNKVHCKVTTETLSLSDPNLRGFYRPSIS